MARPLRPQWQVRTVVRRRHRTWVASMVFATLGWGVWWASLLLYRFVPAVFPGLGWTYAVTCVLAGFGLFLAVFSIRAKLIWVLLAAVPIFANGSLLLVPLLLGSEVGSLLDGPSEPAETGPEAAPG